MATLYQGKAQAGISTIITVRQYERLSLGLPDLPGETATFTDEMAFATSWLGRALTGTLDDMADYLAGHMVLVSEYDNLVPYADGNYAHWGDRWRLSPRQVVAMFELGRVPSEALLGAN